MGDDETTVAGTHDQTAEPGEKHPFLLVLSGNSLGRSRRLSAKSCIIGRGEDVDFPVDDEGISRHHAKLVLLPEGVAMIKDLGSTNGTYVNEQKVSAHPLESGDRIRLGASATLRYSLEDEIEVNVRQQLFAAATRDALTGVHNKRAFDEESIRAMAYARRHRQALCVLLFDLDHFKAVNDTYGHQVGDEVLKMVARRVAEAIRLEDSFARVGGEEFAVTLPGIDLDHGLLAAERIREIVCRSPVETEQGEVKVSISIGVAAFDPDRHQSVSDLVADADTLLYRAKDAGRNCVRPEPRRQRKAFREQTTLVNTDKIREIVEGSQKED